MTCPGSNMVLDAPDDTTHLTCPHCSQRVQVERYTVRKFKGQPEWRLRGHQLPDTEVSQ